MARASDSPLQVGDITQQTTRIKVGRKWGQFLDLVRPFAITHTLLGVILYITLLYQIYLMFSSNSTIGSAQCVDSRTKWGYAPNGRALSIAILGNWRRPLDVLNLRAGIFFFLHLLPRRLCNYRMWKPLVLLWLSGSGVRCCCILY